MSGDLATDDRGRPLAPKRPEASLGELFTQMTADLGTLLRQEVELAKVETKEELGRAAEAGGMLTGGLVAAHLAAIVLSFALAWLLDEWMATAMAFLIVGVIWAVVAAGLVLAGRRRLRDVQPLPETVGSLKEDVAWAKAQRS
jgi:F0F1-type ATP synthase assembly protein I